MLRFFKLAVPSVVVPDIERGAHKPKAAGRWLKLYLWSCFCSFLQALKAHHSCVVNG
jgi:hypothetical protein